MRMRGVVTAADRPFCEDCAQAEKRNSPHPNPLPHGEGIWHRIGYRGWLTVVTEYDGQGASRRRKVANKSL
jgi:hypothetical protein